MPAVTGPAVHRRRPDFGPYAPQVSVRHERDAGRDWIVVEDNGMGMDEEIVRYFFARVGRSYYKSNEFLEERARERLEFSPISQFGIGVLSAFMASDLLRVETRRFCDGALPQRVEIAGRGGLFWFQRATRAAPGTTVRVCLNCAPENLWLTAKRGNVSRKRGLPTIHSTVQRLATHCGIKIISSDVSGKVRIVRERWAVESSVNHCEGINVDLTAANLPGLSGRMRVFVLQDFQEQFYLDEEDVEDNYDEDGEDLRSYLRSLLRLH